MSSLDVLAGLARRLNREAGAAFAPALFFFTDPRRTTDPVAVARRLPTGSGVIYRHFGARDRARVARRLADICRSRGLTLLIAADPPLAQRVGASGVHWPERRVPAHRDARSGIVTVSAHSAHGIARAVQFGAHACFLAPVFPTRSNSGHRPLGVFRASQLARSAPLPVLALGGVDARAARRLAGRGFAGFGAVAAIAEG